MWLKKFKIALAEKNSDAIATLVDEMPRFETVSQMHEAQLLMAQAHEFITLLKNNTENSLLQIQKNRDYLHASESSKDSKLNILT